MKQIRNGRKGWAVVLAAVVLLVSMLACGGTADFAGYDVGQQAHTCPAGQTLTYEHSKGAAICVR